ncbi:hypothetical protein IFM47457_05808 [Aspergillus lentulus]|nr:hypothetical protein IFM47457_05808 [Aspergillus lentulus]
MPCGSTAGMLLPTWRDFPTRATATGRLLCRWEQMFALKLLPPTNVATRPTSPRPIEDVIKRAAHRLSRGAMVARIAAAPPG